MAVNMPHRFFETQNVFESLLRLFESSEEWKKYVPLALPLLAESEQKLKHADSDLIWLLLPPVTSMHSSDPTELESVCTRPIKRLPCVLHWCNVFRSGGVSTAFLFSLFFLSGTSCSLFHLTNSNLALIGSMIIRRKCYFRRRQTENPSFVNWNKRGSDFSFQRNAKKINESA